MDLCPCGEKAEYIECCAQIHDDHSKALSAEKLMRARYSAFAKNNIDFIDSTHVPGTVDFNKEEAQEWAKNSIWKKLEVIKTIDGSENDDRGTVEFKAYYDDQSGNQYIHHEIAHFKKIEGNWYYEDGETPESTPFTRAQPKVGRNEPCPCESGKKFKKCCGK